MTYNIKDLKKVEVVWKDAFSYPDAYSRKQLEAKLEQIKVNPPIWRNVGFMVEQNEDFVALVQNVDDSNGEWNMAKKLWIIPCPYIVSLTELKCV